MADSLLTIGAIARRTGMAVSAIRYYVDEGLVPSLRSSARHRMFERSTIRRVSFILIAQKMGYTLSEIRDLLSTLPAGRTPNKSDWTRLSRQFSTDLDERIAALEHLKRSLDGCIGCGCLSLKACALYNPQDQAIKLGVGPRYLMGNSAADLK